VTSFVDVKGWFTLAIFFGNIAEQCNLGRQYCSQKLLFRLHYFQAIHYAIDLYVKMLIPLNILKDVTDKEMIKMI
jgi:hypothetical protein